MKKTAILILISMCVLAAFWRPGAPARLSDSRDQYASLTANRPERPGPEHHATLSVARERFHQERHKRLLDPTVYLPASPIGTRLEYPEAPRSYRFRPQPFSLQVIPTGLPQRAPPAC